MEKFSVGEKTFIQRKDVGTLLEMNCFTAYVLQDCDLKIMGF